MEQETNNFPPVYEKKTEEKITDFKTMITDEDKTIFGELSPFLHNFNDDQKKAIISRNKNIICIAGAGSGKTTVLTKRIEFLVKYRGVNPRKILAVTFTRKAKEEMKKRLLNLGVDTHVETFNSFCERVLRIYGSRLYGRPTRMINYSERVMVILSALNSIGLNIAQVLDIYFKEYQRVNKTSEELSSSFLNDCFFILDYFKMKNKELYDFSKEVDLADIKSAGLIYQVCNFVKKYMDMAGLRDYTDQLLDTIKFFKNNKEAMPQFEHVLVDEYQDVNDSQIELLDLLSPQNLFCVGDPRQSIFGWRGSDIKHILNFKNKYPDAEIISLIKNYRSSNHIVALINHSIKHMNLPDLAHDFESDNNIYIKKLESEEEEYDFVVSRIKAIGVPFHEVFVLARTNRQLYELSKKMNQNQFPHIIKTDEINRPVFEKEGHVVLSTIHAIKGLEATNVFLIGCSEQNFPCKATDHPVIEMIKIEDYDREEEEKRLFYVAISRAKKWLCLTYSGKKPTYFINEDMQKIIIDEDKTKTDETNADETEESENEGESDNQESENTEEIEEENSGYFGKFNRNLDGSGYSKDYNPYASEEWGE
jgi:superfamily I DNA/RNA helicase